MDPWLARPTWYIRCITVKNVVGGMPGLLMQYKMMSQYKNNFNHEVNWLGRLHRAVTLSGAISGGGIKISD